MHSVTMGSYGKSQAYESANLDSNQTFKQGQIIYGRVNKIISGQTAEVQIGHQKIQANLEAALKTGDHYWLQVVSGEGKPTMKVLDSVSAPAMTIKEVAQQLLDQLGVASSKNSKELAEFFLKNELPITKEMFQSALQWMKSADSIQSGFSILKIMFDQKLPFITEVFNALNAQSKSESLHEMLNQLLSGISNSKETHTTIQLKGVLASLVTPIEGQIQEMGLPKLLSYWLNSNSTKDSQTGAYSLLQKTGFISEKISEADLLMKLEKDFQTVDLKNDVLKNIQQSLKTNSELQNQKNEPQMIMKGLETILNEMKTGNVDVSASKKTMFSDFLALFNSDGQQVNQAKKELTNQIQLLMQNREDPQLLSNERAVLQLLANEFKSPDFTNAGTIANHLKELTKMLGLQFEQVLANAHSLGAARLDEELITLKPLLLKLLKEQQPAIVKEIAEKVVDRITAQQILSQENGPMQNVLLTLPLNIGNYQTDATLQWSGRKRGDGSIDPNYCRILFYLDLEQIKETIIDMQVQNRVINMIVINERSEWLESTASPFVKVLRKNLEQMDYTLSGVAFENVRNSPVVEDSKDSKPLIPLIASSYNGVDIRI